MKVHARWASLVALLLMGCATSWIRSKPQDPSPASRLDGQSRLPDLPIEIARDDDYVVRVVANEITCSGTLIAEQLVLTAHHCIAERNEFGDFQPRDLPAKVIRVELGSEHLAWGEVGVKAVVAPPCGYAAGEGDIAVLVLDRPLAGMVTLEPALDWQPEVGTHVDPVGFGRCALSDVAVRRRAREGGIIHTVGRTRYRLEASICPGDSGGPAIDRSGQLVGVISASVMDGNGTTTGPSEFTRLDRWREVFANAERLVEDDVSLAELPPVGGCPSP